MREQPTQRSSDYKRITMLGYLLLLTVFVCGCQPPGRKADVLAELQEHRANYAKAVMYNKQGLENIDDQSVAQEKFRQAIDADELYGPAHNNLAILLAKKAQLYEAAQHFQLAAKYMPGKIK